MDIEEIEINKEDIKKNYCRNCGKELLETDKFCPSCGHSIKPHNVHSNIEAQSSDLPMNWWKFWQYVRFPIGIIFTAINIADYLPALEVNMVNIFAFLTDVSLLVLMIVTYYHFLMQNKIGYKFLNAWLIIELVCNSLNATIKTLADNYGYITLIDFVGPFLFTVCIIGIVWTVPNYMYFKKRKSLFNDSVKNSEKERNEYQKENEELKRIIEKLENK